MSRLLFLFLLTILPLFANSLHLVSSVSAEKPDGKSLVLSSKNTKQSIERSQEGQPYLQSQLSVALILFGLAFMIAEIFVPGFGILGIGGVVSFTFGSLLLIDADTIGRSFFIALIIAFSLSSLAFFVLVMRVFFKSKSAKVISGADMMVGTCAEVIGVKEKGYLVRCHGETWSATSEDELFIGQSVKVVELLGLILRVKLTKE